jgi:hypothetical protein
MDFFTLLIMGILLNRFVPGFILFLPPSLMLLPGLVTGSGGVTDIALILRYVDEKYLRHRKCYFRSRFSRGKDGVYGEIYSCV